MVMEVAVGRQGILGGFGSSPMIMISSQLFDQPPVYFVLKKYLCKFAVMLTVI